MASLQDQIDELRCRLAKVQADLENRAEKEEVHTLNSEVSDNQVTIADKLDSLEGCIREILDNLMDIREKLSTHTH